MFGLGFPEILCIILIAVIVLGPEHMPKAARLIGKWSAKIRSAATSFEQAVIQDEDIREIKTNLEDVKSEIDKAKSELLSIKEDVSAVPGDVSKAYREAQDELATCETVVGRRAVSPSVPQNEEKPANTGDAPSAQPEPSPFLSRPLSWFDPDEKAATQPGVIRLEAPKLLPGPVARRVYRKRYELDTPAVPSPLPGIRFQPVQPQTAFCRIRRLEHPHSGHARSLRTLPLKRHE